MYSVTFTCQNVVLLYKIVCSCWDTRAQTSNVSFPETLVENVDWRSYKTAFIFSTTFISHLCTCIVICLFFQWYKRSILHLISLCCMWPTTGCKLHLSHLEKLFICISKQSQVITSLLCFLESFVLNFKLLTLFLLIY